MMMLWDGALLVGLWFGATILRIWLRDVWSPEIFDGAIILEEVDFQTHARLVLPILVVWIFWMARLGAYRVHVGLRMRQLWIVSLLALCTLLSLLFSVRATDELSRSLYFSFAFASAPAIWSGRRLMLWLQHRSLLPSQSWELLLVGNAETLNPIRDSIRERTLPGYKIIVPTIPHPNAEEPGSIQRLRRAVDDQVVDHVLVGPGWTEGSLKMVAEICEEVGIPFSIDANFVGRSRIQMNRWSLESTGLLSFSTVPSEVGLAIKRAIDIVCSVILLIVTLPIMSMVALLIRLLNGGPAIFSQIRVGQNGRPFEFYKFRTMVPDAELRKEQVAHLNEVSGPVFKSRRDPRVTRLGRFLRRSSIDELPQLWNVLRGDMSLVGPRPPIPAEVARYERWQLRRLSMKPGLTCIWQVSGRSNVDFERWMRQDLEYIDNWSLSLDFKLLVRTVPAVISGSGAH